MKKRLPSKTSNYATLIDESAFYVDKTHYIQTLESINDRYIFFLRPRRFGKSLHLSMLEHYYGIQHKNRFAELFGEYFIGKPENTTPLHNTYHTLSFSFSGITTDVKEDIKEKFDVEIRSALKNFLYKYGIGSEAEIDRDLSVDGGGELLRNFAVVFRKYRPEGKIYLLIDEYDHFTNELFAFNKEHFKEIVTQNGWVRKFYEVIKQLMGEGLIDRFFATGVTPVTLDSMTSGFNVAHNISLDQKFHEMAGFTELELKSLIENTIHNEGKFELDSLIPDMRAWYNGSKFSANAGERLYNPQMVITFLAKFSDRFEYPDEMSDINVTSDYKKIANILGLLTAEEADAIIEEILESDSVSEKLTLQFNFELPYTRIEAISLLFYNGLLTIKDAAFQVYDLVIPNHVIKVLYWEYFRSLFEARNQIKYESVPVRDALIEMATAGRIDKLVAYVNEVLKNLSNRDLIQFTEKNIKMIFMTLLMGNNAYFVRSEQENNEGYTDLLLIPTGLNPGKFNFLLELKYIKKSDSDELETEKLKAIEQVSRYRESLAKDGIDCKAFAVLFSGKSDYMVSEVK